MIAVGHLYSRVFMRPILKKRAAAAVRRLDEPFSPPIHSPLFRLPAYPKPYLGLHVARMHGIGRHPAVALAEPPLQLHGEDHIGQLTLPHDQPGTETVISPPSSGEWHG